MQVKTILRSGAIAAIALMVYPLLAEAIPQRSRTACIRSTAEEMGVPVGNIMITDVGHSDNGWSVWGDRLHGRPGL